MREFETIPLGASESATEDKRIRQQYAGNSWYLEQNSIPVNGSISHFEPWFKGTNNETHYLMHLLTNNPIVGGLIVTKCDILRGKCLTLFDMEERDKKGNPRPLELSEFPSEIQEFYEYNELNLWAYQSFYSHESIGNCFSEFIFSKGSSKAKKKIIDINYLSPELMRAQKSKDKRGKVERYGVSNSWKHGLKLEDVERIPAFHHKDFYRNGKFVGDIGAKKLIFHGKRNLPHLPVYSVPRWYGARNWIETQNLVPIFHKSNLANLFGLRMQMSISREIVNRLMAQGDGKGNAYTEKQVLDNLAEMATKFFTNPENAGKTIATSHNYDHQGKIIKSIDFEKIDVDLKDDAYSKLDPVLKEAVTSSLGTSPTLAGIASGNNLPSGSEQRVSWNIEVTKGAFLRNLILKPLLFAHKFNGWGNRYKWGFQDDKMVTLDEDKDGVKAQGETDPKLSKEKPEAENVSVKKTN